MVFSDEFKRKLNTFFALGVLAIAAIFLFIRFDIYYDLNDDIMIKDILTGIYSGTPETRNMQMLYPLSFLLAILYHVVSFVPWYGILLIGSQLLCLYLIAKRCMEFCAKVIGKCIMSVTILSIWAGLFLYRFVFIQYTVTAGILVGTAIFRFMTNYSTDPDEVSFTQDTARVTQDNMPVGLFVRKNLLNMIMLILAFCIRSEMALLTLPLIAVAFVLKWADERPIFTRQNVEKFVSVALFVVFFCGVAFSIDHIAYSRTKWENFRELFDARTEVYDFSRFLNQGYEENQAFYESIGVSEAEYRLLLEYDYGMSDHVDHVVMKQIADQAILQREQETPWVKRARNAVWEYVHFYFEDRFQPWVYITWILASVALISACLQGHFQIVWKFILLGCMRMVCWFYLYYRGRVLDRVTMPLLFVEVMILMAMLFMEFGIVVIKQNGYNPQLRRMRIMTKWEERRETAVRFCPKFALLLLFLTSVLTVPYGYHKTVKEFNHREMAGEFFDTFFAYLKENEDIFFWEDVYSMTSVTLKESGDVVFTSEKVFADVSTAYRNADLLGGWFNKSPLYLEKLAYAEQHIVVNDAVEQVEKEPIASGSEVVDQLCNSDSYRLIAYADRDMQFLVDYMDELGVEAELVPVDEITSEAIVETLVIYSVSGKMKEIQE